MEKSKEYVNPLGDYVPRRPEDVLCETANDTAEWMLMGGESPMPSYPISKKIPKKLADMLGVK